jgi:hypothetical protein
MQVFDAEEGLAVTADDRFGDPSETFTASREGLLYLRQKIDEALAKGEATIGSELSYDFRGSLFQ